MNIKIKVLTPLEAAQMRPDTNWGGNYYMRDKFDGIKIHFSCLAGAWHEVGCQCKKAYKKFEVEVFEELEEDED